MAAKPGRKPAGAATPVPVNVNHEALAEANQAADQLISLQAGYSEGRDLLNQLLGQAQMADAFEEFSRTVRTSKLAFVKENKLYQQLRGKVSPDGPEFSGTWAEFCGLIGRSVDQVDDDIKNLRSFGESALESMSRMGIGYRELRQYRKLPEDQKQALIEVAKAGDKEGFVELAEEIIARHAKEKEALTAQAEEAAATLEAKDRVLADKSARITKLEEQASRKFRPQAGSEARTAQEQALLDELHAATAEAQIAMRRLFLAADAALDGTGREAIELAGRHAVEFLCQQLVDVANEFSVAVNFEERLRPAWLDEDTLAAMEARQAAATAGEGAAR